MATERSGFIIVLLLALAMRASWSLAVPVAPVSDGQVYDDLARNIASGIGYAFVPGHPSAYWPVGTSAVYAALYWVFGVSYTPIVVLNVMIGGLTVALVMTLTRRWYGSRASLYAGLILAVWPGQVTFSTILASELLFNIGWLAGLYFASRTDWAATLRVPLVAVSLAASSLVRPLALLMPLIFVWIRLAGSDRESQKSWRSPFGVGVEAVATLALMLVLLIPWAERNQRTMGERVLVSTNGGANLWMGNNPDTRGTYMSLPDKVKDLDEVARDRMLRDEAIAFIKAQPLAFVRRTAYKIYLTHERETHGITWNEKGLVPRFGQACLKPLKLVSSVYWWTMLALGLVGAGCVYRRYGFLGLSGDPAIVLWTYFAVLHAIIVAGDRYHYPSVPPIAALAGLALATWTEHRTKNSVSAPGIPPGYPEPARLVTEDCLRAEKL